MNFRLWSLRRVGIGSCCLAARRRALSRSVRHVFVAWRSGGGDGGGWAEESAKGGVKDGVQVRDDEVERLEGEVQELMSKVQELMGKVKMAEAEVEEMRKVTLDRSLLKTRWKK